MQPWIGNPPVPPKHGNQRVINETSNEISVEFWDAASTTWAPGIMLLRFVELCLAPGTQKNTRRIWLHLVFSRAAGQMKFRQLLVSNFFPFGLSLNCNVCLYYINCIHFWTLYKSTKEQIPQLKKLPLGTTIHESRSCSFSDIAMAELVGTPVTSTENQKKKSLAGPFSEVKIVCSNHQSQRHLSFQSPHVLSDVNRRTGSSVARDGLIPHLPVRLSAKARQNSREAAF